MNLKVSMKNIKCWIQDDSYVYVIVIVRRQKKKKKNLPNVKKNLFTKAKAFDKKPSN